MDDTRVPRLRLVDADEDARFGDMLNVMAGVRTSVNVRQPAGPPAAELSPLLALVERLEERLAALEAEVVPPHRSRKCPCCHRLSLTVVATRGHPEFGIEGIEQHDVRCSCGYQTTRLYDPSDFLR